MVSIGHDEFEALRKSLSAATAQGLYETYRISQNTWYKLRDGKPVKRKTLDQLRARYRALSRSD
ncbi:hypothetical protein COO09_12040 [Rhizorhabdus dicambivorans]|uniref:Transcriptional regulator n=2 Tax=Rhizorhabdus dicambivorans TaxID=1850238 RepID=A0A2A4FWP5_9SPHN|nr:hypothetical protein CMV14_18335 [Rhizorhabdus dicambivorans]PCE42111.1 hypothetical protein COO09_12040 [Rhizorhabdus dicambivorans]